MTTKDISESYYKNFFKSYKSDLSFFTSKKILITGATGLIGGGFVDFFYWLNQELGTNTQLFLHGRNKDKLEKRFGDYCFNFVSGDLISLDLSTFHFDVIIHAASPASPKDYIGDDLNTFKCNFEFTIKALKFNQENNPNCAFLFVSSGDVYGAPSREYFPTSENFNGNVELFGARSMYAQSKRIAETVISVFREKYSMNVKSVRPFNIYGPGQRLEDGRLIMDFVKKGMKNEAIELFSDGSPLRAFCFISDCISSSILCLINGKETYYNIGNRGQELSVKEMAIIASDVMKIPEPKFAPPPEYQSGSISRCCPCTKKVDSEFDYQSNVSFKKGIEVLWSYHQKNT